jgi:nicotinamidase-related amidase
MHPYIYKRVGADAPTCPPEIVSVACWVVEGTARYAADADCRVIVLEDCCAGISKEAHDFSIANVLSTIAEVSTSQEFLASLK